MSNAFAALQDSDSDSDSNVSDVEMPKPQAKKSKVQPPAQSGGSFAQRRDPMTGVSMGNSSDNPLEFDPADVEACLRVVTAVGANINLFKLPQLKPLRAALHPLIVEQMKNYDPKSLNDTGKDKSKRNRNNKRKNGGSDDVYDDLQKMQKQKLAALEEEYVNQTQLRALRLRQLEQLNDEGFQPRVPDGVAICSITEARFDASNKMLLGNDHQVERDAGGALLLGDKGSDSQDISASSSASSSSNSLVLSSTTPLKSLINPISCYICHKPYVDLHFFYHQLCPACATFNYAKREEKADMRDRVCLVTGGRTKIGYRSALKLLRCGARVVVTTRFPHDAAVRFAAEKDNDLWLDRLDIYGLDFRDLMRLEEFCSYLQITYERLDVIINNACQTIRRPPAYYQHLIADEVHYAEEGKSSIASTKFICDANRKIDKILQKQSVFCTVTVQSEQMKLQNDCSATGGGDMKTTRDGIKALSSLAAVADMQQIGHSPSSSSSSSGSSSRGRHGLNSVQLSQLVVAPGDESTDPSLFPTGSLDVNRQQVDLRTHNSWTMKLHEVSTPELAEVFAINTMAPTILNSRLKGMMQRFPDELKFIVNVSAMEGKFYRFKSERHPHTNMAKAALNMLTRTSAQDYIKSNIHMTSVDTGWINDEKPIALAVKHEQKHKFQTPLDEIDAAARVLDPVIGPLNAQQRGETPDPPWGVFLKDYMKCEW